MRILVLSFILLCGILSFTSCGEAPVFTKSYSFENNEWKQDVKPVFKVTIPDTINRYNIAITLRTTTDYAYSNLWFFLHTKTPQGQTGREPIEIKIAHPDGSWVGEKSGTVVETKVMFNHRQFPQAGVYTFTFEQGITEQIAKEIMDISYTVTKDISNEN